MMKRSWLAIAVMVLPTFALAQSAPLAPAKPATQAAATQSTQFLRYVSDPQASRLEAAEVTYANPQGVLLRLVAAVHIADDSYYRAISDNFAKDDAVLYELIKERGRPAPAPGAQNDHAVAQLQKFLRDKLDLAFQLDAIDYRKPNFVHADLDLETFQQLQEQRGESMASLLMNSMTEALAKGDSGSGDSASQLVFLLASPDPSRQMKTILAQQMQDIESIAMGLDGPNGSVLLSERNKAAIRVLKQQLAAGKKHLSIFYGAAHMPDLARRVESLGFAPVSTQWHTAWDVTIRRSEPSMLQKWFGQGPATAPTTQP